MKTNHQTVCLSIALLFVALATADVNAQDQQWMAEQILNGDADGRNRALQGVEALGGQNAGSALRAALATALEREGRVHALRFDIKEKGGLAEPLEDPLWIARLTRVVAGLRDPATIPVLVDVLATGSTASTLALADFGERATPAVLAMLESPHSRPHQIDEGLIALRMMVEGNSAQHLSAATITRIRDVAEQRLTEKQSGTGATLRWAIDLAVVLEDRGLRRIVEIIASDPDQLITRGVTDADLIEMTQKRAADRLAGIPPLPRRR